MARKKRNDGEDSGMNVRLVLTVSLFLILLTFFILLNSIAVRDERKTRAALGSLTGAFGNLPGGLSPLKTGESVLPPSSPMINGELDLTQFLLPVARGIPAEIKIEKRKGKEVITIKQETLFYAGNLKIRPSVYPLLNKVCEFIKTGRFSVEVAGHTDNRPAQEKGYSSNWELSALMAIQVLRYFTEKGKIPLRRICAYGCGGYEPVTSNDTRLSRAENSRVEIILNTDAPPYIKRIYRKKPAGLFTYKNFDFKVLD